MRQLAFICAFLSWHSSWASRDPSDSTGWQLVKAADDFRGIGHVQQSLQHYFQALRLAEQQQDSLLTASVSLKIGSLYEFYYRYAESIPYLKRAYALIAQSDSTQSLAHTSNAIAWNYIKIGWYDSALHYSRQSVALYDSLENPQPFEQCIALESLGEIYSYQRMYREATVTLDRCMSLAKAHELSIAIGFTNYGIALNELHQQHFEKARTHILDCLPVAEKYASQQLLADVYHLVYRVHEQTGHSAEAYKYLEKYSDLKDKIHSEDIEKKAAIINANFEIQKKEDDLKILNQLNSIQQLEIQQQRWVQNTSIVSFVGVLIIGGLIYARLRAKRKFEQRELQRKKEELEQARKVQLSLLPQKAMDNERIEVRGKMITATEVGGDYYDYFEIDSHRTLIAFGDATGHGITAGLIVTIAKVSLINNLPRLQNSHELTPIVKAINDSILSSVSIKGIGLAFQLFLIDTLQQTLTFTSNGMPYPMVYDFSLGTFTTLEMRQPPLGFFRSVKADQRTVAWTSKHLLLLTSDGILERFNTQKDEYGLDRLKAYMQATTSQTQSIQVILDNLFLDTDQFAGGIHHHDDMTVLGARVKPAANAFGPYPA